MAHPLTKSIFLLFYLHISTTDMLIQTNEFIFGIYILKTIIWNIHIRAFNPDSYWNQFFWRDPLIPCVYAQSIKWYHLYHNKGGFIPCCHIPKGLRDIFMFLHNICFKFLGFLTLKGFGGNPPQHFVHWKVLYFHISGIYPVLEK